MKVLLTGASGLVGAAVARRLAQQGHAVIALRRGARLAAHPSWDPAGGTIDLVPAGALDAVIHLAGENIAAGRWTPARKAAIWDSRVRGTELLSRALAGLPSPPAVLLAASAVGYYGRRGSEAVDEGSVAGSGFLADLCRAWEGATAAAAAAGIRVVQARLGMVLSPSGGALARLLPPFRLGLGGRVGAGSQFMSWVTLDDLAGMLLFLLSAASLRGPVNCVSPGAVTNREFTRTLGRVLRRPTCCPLPAFLARALFGEMADALLLTGARVLPRRLEAAGYRFEDPELAGAFRRMLAARCPE